MRTTEGTLITCDAAARELIIFWSQTERFVLKSDLGPNKLLVKTDSVELIRVRVGEKKLFYFVELLRIAQAEGAQRRAELHCKNRCYRAGSGRRGGRERVHLKRREKQCKIAVNVDEPVVLNDIFNKIQFPFTFLSLQITAAI